MRKSPHTVECCLLLVEHFAKELRDGIRFSRDALNEMLKYDWPGNVRELRNVVQRTVLMCRHVTGVVNGCDGNRLKASRILQCDPKTVRKYLALYQGE